MTLAPPHVRQARAIARAYDKELRANRPRMDAGPKLHPTPGDPTARRFTPKQKAEAFARQGGRCPDCGVRFAIGDMEMDHRVALKLGGAEDASNHQCMCAPCHLEKTRDDIRRIAKAKRQSALLGPREPKRPWPSRGFQ